MPDEEPTPTAEELHQLAVHAYANRDYECVSANASMAAVAMLQEFLALARDSAGYEWAHIHLPDGGAFPCVCGSQAFTDYPTPGDLPYVTCATPECLAVWDLGQHADSAPAPRRVQPLGPPEPWQPHRLVRRRDRYATPIGEHVADFVALLQRPVWSPAAYWEATVVETDPLTGRLVGQGVTLVEGDPKNVMAQFPE